MTAVNNNIAPLVAGLQARLAELGDGRDCKSANERIVYHTTYNDISRVISALRNAPDDLARAQARLDALEAERAAVIEKQAELEHAIASAPDWQAIRDGRERDREYDRQAALQRQLAMLADGTLLSGPSTTYPTLPYIDGRIREMTDRRDRAQMALDAHIAAAEQLLAAQPVAS